MTILFYGDSLTAGYGLSDPSTQGYPALIGDKIKSAGLKYEIINAGLSGDTSQGGVSRLDYWLGRKIDVFVLELGINDIMRGVSPVRTYNNLSAIIEKVKSKYPQTRIVLMGMELPPFISAGPVEEFRTIYQKLSTHHKIALVPFFLKGVLGVRSLNLPDGLHPSREGYKVIAETVWPIIRPLL
ncbi:MAG: arylesterase [Chryseolinea sp.]